MRARRLGPHLRAVLARKWAERPNRGEGTFCFGRKHKVSQGYSPADENAGLAYALRDDTLVNGLNKRRNSNCTTTRNFVGLSCKEGTSSKDTNAVTFAQRGLDRLIRPYLESLSMPAPGL